MVGSVGMVSGVTLLPCAVPAPPTLPQQGNYFDLFFQELVHQHKFYYFPFACLELWDAIYIGHMGDVPMTSVQHKWGSKTHELMGHTQNHSYDFILKQERT